MIENTGELNLWNPDKQISEQITLKNLIIHNNAMRLTRTGVGEDESEKPKNLNDRNMLRFQGLNEVISAQQILVGNALPIVECNDKNDWRKRNKTDEEKLANKFKDLENDYNELNAIMTFLDECEQKIIKAARTKTVKDDFVLEKQNSMGEVTVQLSENFFKMLKELEESYKEIFGILLRHKIVSSGIQTDDELEDKQKEEEAMRRIVEA